MTDGADLLHVVQKQMRSALLKKHAPYLQAHLPTPHNLDPYVPVVITRPMWVKWSTTTQYGMRDTSCHAALPGLKLLACGQAIPSNAKLDVTSGHPCASCLRALRTAITPTRRKKAKHG